MSESIVQKEKPVQSHVNPFAKNLADHINVGAVTIESERAIAEAQGKLVIAKRFPRDQARAYSNIIDACKRHGLAEEACYSFPRGGEVINGPAIRLAEMLAANWGNVDYGIRELSRKEGISEMEAYCWDLETNTMSSQKFTVRHIRDTRGGGKALTDERDIYELTANMGARRLRARILAILPADLVQAAVEECGRTLAGGNGVPMADRIRKMVTAFKALGVPAGLIEKRLGHPLDNLSGDELADLTKIHNSLRDGMSKMGDWFGEGEKSASAEDVPYGEQEQAPRPAPPPRTKKGAAAVVENAKPADKAIDVQATAAREAGVVKAFPPAAVTGAAATAEAAPASPVVPPAGDQPRAFLKDGEEITTICEVVEVTPLMMAMRPAGGGDPETKPSVKVILKGGYNGEATHHGGGTGTPPEMGWSPLWEPGNGVKVKLMGKLQPMPTDPKKVTKYSGKVVVRVMDVQQEGSPVVPVENVD